MVDGGRIRTIRGDQSDPDSLNRVLAEIGRPDIVIDDGSHVSRHVLTRFRAVFPHLRPGGKYVIEDLQTSYWPSFGGNDLSLSDTLAELVDTAA